MRPAASLMDQGGSDSISLEMINSFSSTKDDHGIFFGEKRRKGVELKEFVIVQQGLHRVKFQEMADLLSIERNSLRVETECKLHLIIPPLYDNA